MHPEHVYTSTTVDTVFTCVMTKDIKWESETTDIWMHAQRRFYISCYRKLHACICMHEHMPIHTNCAPMRTTPTTSIPYKTRYSAERKMWFEILQRYTQLCTVFIVLLARVSQQSPRMHCSSVINKAIQQISTSFLLFMLQQMCFITENCTCSVNL